MLPAAGEEWRVELLEGVRASGRSGSWTRHDRSGTLVVAVGSGGLGRAVVTRAVLLEWLRSRAREVLVPRLASMAAYHGFSYLRVQVRCQRTRWASCSGRGTISLNAKLLFLESRLVDHILLHELCHTVVPDHSRHFWALLERYDPDCAQHRRALRRAHDCVPDWAK